MFEKIRKVRCRSLIPDQQRTSISLLRSADCYQQKFLKFPKVGVFHSYAELLHAALLESNCLVTSFVPQPFRFLIGRQQYIPDCYCVYNGRRTVLEIKAGGKLKAKLYDPIKFYLKANNIDFKVIDNKEILGQEIFCQNWLYVIRTLIGVTDIDTKGTETRIYKSFLHQPKQIYGDYVNIFNRLGKSEDEIALLRLVHHGKLGLSMVDKSLDLDTEVTLCQ